MLKVVIFPNVTIDRWSSFVFTCQYLKSMANKSILQTNKITLSMPSFCVLKINCFRTFQSKEEEKFNGLFLSKKQYIMYYNIKSFHINNSILSQESFLGKLIWNKNSLDLHSISKPLLNYFVFSLTKLDFF